MTTQSELISEGFRNRKEILFFFASAELDPVEYSSPSKYGRSDDVEHLTVGQIDKALRKVDRFISKSKGGLIEIIDHIDETLGIESFYIELIGHQLLYDQYIKYQKDGIPFSFDTLNNDLGLVVVGVGGSVSECIDAHDNHK